jgi:hypothetical protein
LQDQYGSVTKLTLRINPNVFVWFLAPLQRWEFVAQFWITQPSSQNIVAQLQRLSQKSSQEFVKINVLLMFLWYQVVKPSQTPANPGVIVSRIV